MPDSDFRHEWRACDTGNVFQLVNNARIRDESPATGKQEAEFGSYETTQITSVIAHGMDDIVQHDIVYLIHSTGNRFQQSSPSDDRIKVERYLFGLQRFQYQVLAEFKLIDNTWKCG